MLLTRETSRTRWLVLGATWVVLATFLAFHVQQIRGYIGLLDSMCRRGATQLSTPLQLPTPTMFADAQTWTRHALGVLETNDWRVRHTQIDNAPIGREVHWHSGLAWLIALGGWARHLVTGEPLPLAVEQWLFWINAALLLALAIGFATWTARHLGAAAAAFVALAMAGNSDIYLQFVPTFADHHGLLTMANFGVVLGALGMGAGWWLPPKHAALPLPPSRAFAHHAMLFSALTGAAGMWVSAASVVPAIAIVGGAAIAATCWQGPALRAAGAVFEPELWRRWGLIGGGASLFFYLLEYAPNHLALRMEVNHPFYAVAWWGGGELVAQLCAWRLDGGAWGPRLRRLVLPLVAALLPAVVIAVGGAKVFIVRDPMILRISARVAEGLSLVKSIQHYGWHYAWLRLPWVIAALFPAIVLLFRRDAVSRFALAFALLTCLAFVGLGFFQVRFFANVGGPEICLILTWVVVLAGSWRPARRWALLGALAAALCVPERLIAVRETARALEGRSVSRIDAVQPLYRDIAATLRRNQPDGEIVLLTNPNASTAIGYYGRLKTIGTLYWENLAGVKAAAEMTSAMNERSARPLMAARGVTHIAIISEFAFVEEYFRLLHPESTGDGWRSGLVYQLFSRQAMPVWLEEVPYQPPADALIPDLRVVIYRTRFAAPEVEGLFAQARDQAVAGDLAAAERSLDRALAADANKGEFWVLKAELLLARGAVQEAGRATENAFRLSPLSHRAQIAGALGTEFYKKGAQNFAAQLYRASLGLQLDHGFAANLAWILATSQDAALRDGAAALPLAERAVQATPDSYHFVSVLAAAQAENEQWEQAIATAQRALELARSSTEPQAREFAQARLKSYVDRQKWRQ